MKIFNHQRLRAHILCRILWWRVHITRPSTSLSCPMPIFLSS